MTKNRFAIFDVSNMVYRIGMAQGKSAGSRGDSVEDSANLALASAIRSMRVPYDLLGCTHAVMCFDHRSWRKDVLASYKESRSPENTDPKRQEIKDKISAAITDFRGFLKENTNSTVLHVAGCEADDLIYAWTTKYPDSDHVIVSSDSDFKQLVKGRVSLFNAGTGTLLDESGVYKYEFGKSLRGKHTKHIHGNDWEIVMDKEGKPEKVDPAYELFEKVMLGDSSDDIPRASPPRTLKKVLREAYDHWGGAAWTDLMSTVRKDLDPQRAVVDLYEEGTALIDLSKAPDHISKAAYEAIDQEASKPQKGGLGVKFMMFCRDRNMLQLGQDAARYAPMLSARIS